MTQSVFFTRSVHFYYTRQSFSKLFFFIYSFLAFWDLNTNPCMVEENLPPPQLCVITVFLSTTLCDWPAQSPFRAWGLIPAAVPYWEIPPPPLRVGGPGVPVSEELFSTDKDHHWNERNTQISEADSSDFLIYQGALGSSTIYCHRLISTTKVEPKNL